MGKKTPGKTSEVKVNKDNLDRPVGVGSWLTDWVEHGSGDQISNLGDIIIHRGETYLNVDVRGGKTEGRV